ncbi:MAG: alpha/beta hydrolase family protein [Terriglobales bacterium]
MKAHLAALVLLTAAVCSAQAQSIVGEWRGTLRAGPSELRLALHVTKSPNGALHATLDSLDQGSIGIPVSAIEVKDAHVNLEVAAVAGSYTGTIAADGTQITGTWTQGGNSRPLVFTTPREDKPVQPSELRGDWLGALHVNGVQLRLAFHLQSTVDGITGTMDSLDQNAKGFPIKSVALSGAEITIVLPMGKFQGKFDRAAIAIDGTWAQGGASLPLTLKPVKDPATLEVRRPQVPQKPYPYREEEVAYENKSANIRLAGTITIPEGKPPFAAVLLITGSGPQDRDESIMGHKPFLILADYLTRKGIAVLRVDDRGVGKSGGSMETSTMADFATDVEAGIAYLKTRPEIDAHQIGLIGHSEGGVIAPMVAARNPDVAFIVMLAGSGVPGDELIVEQTLALNRAVGSPATALKATEAEQRWFVALVKSEPDVSVLKSKLRERWTGKLPEARINQELAVVSLPWYRYFVSYDPTPALRNVKCPVLAINGEKDLQVPPKENLAAIRKALEAGGNKNFETVELAGLNHLLQPATTGLPSEYGQIEETMSPKALQTISDWVLKQVGTTKTAALK